MKRYVCKNRTEIEFIQNNYLIDSCPIESYGNNIFTDDNNKFKFVCSDECSKCTHKRLCGTENFENINVIDLIRKEKFKFLING